jgi:DNA primase
MIRKEDIARVLETARIEEVIGDFVKLKRSGSTYVGLCPFHSEKTPSFHVNPALGIFKCFGCGKGGNIITFLREHEKFSYIEAIRYLAQRYGIELIEVRDEISEEEQISRTEEEQAYHIHSFAHQWFMEQLWETGEGQSVGLEYFRKRGLTDATIKKFGLGYSPIQKDAFLQYALKQGYSIESLQKNGLVTEHKLDKFAGRVIFPIHSIAGRVIAFAGRLLQSNSNAPKYLNSPETIIYKKNQTLYGLHHAKSKIVHQDECFLVEGYMDVLSLSQLGFENVVASSGTSLTEGQIRLLSRYTENVTILYDGDTAGQKATLRAIDMLLEAGLSIRIISLPPSEDPDTFALKHKYEEVNDYFRQHKQTFIEFKAAKLLQEAQNDPIKKAEAIADIVRSISLIPKPVIRDQFILDVAKKFELNEKTLMLELNKQLSQRLYKGAAVTTSSPSQQILSTFSTERDRYLAELNLLRTLLLHGDRELTLYDEDNLPTSMLAAQYVIQELESDQISFENPDFQNIYQKILQLVQENNFSLKTLITLLDAGEATTISSLLMEQTQLSSNWEENDIFVESTQNNNYLLLNEINTTILRLKYSIVQQHIFVIEQALKNNPDEEKLQELLHDYIRWDKLAKEIGKHLHLNINPGKSIEHFL